MVITNQDEGRGYHIGALIDDNIIVDDNILTKIVIGMVWTGHSIYVVCLKKIF